MIIIIILLNDNVLELKSNETKLQYVMKLCKIIIKMSLQIKI